MPLPERAQSCKYPSATSPCPPSPSSACLPQFYRQAASLATDVTLDGAALIGMSPPSPHLPNMPPVPPPAFAHNIQVRSRWLQRAAGCSAARKGTTARATAHARPRGSPSTAVRFIGRAVPEAVLAPEARLCPSRQVLPRNGCTRLCLATVALGMATHAPAAAASLRRRPRGLRAAHLRHRGPTDCAKHCCLTCRAQQLARAPLRVLSPPFGLSPCVHVGAT